MSDFLADILSAPMNSPLILSLSIAYTILQAITVYDVRLNQARMGIHSSAVAEAADFKVLPNWVALFIWAEWLVFITLLILNWKYAIGLWIAVFLLKLVPVLESVGALLMKPFLRAV